MIVPVILAGGSGSRLWPVSRNAYPKQLLPLVSQNTLLQDTILRTRSIKNVGAPTVICNQEHRFLVAEQLQSIGIEDATIILEPVGKNTAPATAIAAMFHEKNDPILLILPADHLIKDSSRFAELINDTLSYALSGKLVMFGVIPTHPETGYGYIKTSTSIGRAYAVDQFIEKPDLLTANSFLESGQYYWNSGIFMFRASRFLTELELHASAIFNMCKINFSHLKKDLDFVRLNKTAFNECPCDSIDYAVMEKTQNAVLVPLNTDWSDIGSWSALCEAQEPNQDGNVIYGDVIIENVKNSYLRAESRMLAAVGMSDHIVVETPDAVLVAHKNSSQDIKKIVTHLNKIQRSEVELHKKVYRPWGYYESLVIDDCFQVKRINIKPNSSLSLQMHQHRSEHWVVVRGTAQVTCGDKTFLITKNESTFIPKKVKHRLVNPTNERLEIIEIQLGDYLGEDDIIRYEDSYDRMQLQE